MIIGKDIDEVLYKACLKLRDAEEYSPRGFKTKEILQETLIVEDPSKCIITNPGRKLSEDYIRNEIDWYLSGDKSANEIGEKAAMWKKIADEDGNVNSNYGEMIFKQKLENFSMCQWAWVIHSLYMDKDSRQALINFNQTKHKYAGVKDFPCTISIQYLIRNNKLISITNMRSNDLVYGFGNDFPFFAYLQQRLLKEMQSTYPELTLGPNIHTAGSLHTYERHYEMMETIINLYELNKPRSKEWKQ